LKNLAGHGIDRHHEGGIKLSKGFRGAFKKSRQGIFFGPWEFKGPGSLEIGVCLLNLCHQEIEGERGLSFGLDAKGGVQQVIKTFPEHAETACEPEKS